MNGAPQRKLREEDLLFWAEKVLGQAEPLVLGDFRDGILLLRILQRVLGGEPRVAKTIGFAMHDPAGSLQERMENLALVDAVLREHGSDGLRLSAMLTGDDSLDLEQVERGNVGAIASLLMVLYRFYCTKSTTDVRRVKVRAKNAKARPASLNTTEASATAAIAAIGPAAVQERAHGARGGAWDGWQGETVIGLLPVKETLSIVSQADGAGAYKEKMAVLTAHACWLSVGSFPWRSLQCCGGVPANARALRLPVCCARLKHAAAWMRVDVLAQPASVQLQDSSQSCGWTGALIMTLQCSNQRQSSSKIELTTTSVSVSDANTVLHRP